MATLGVKLKGLSTTNSKQGHTQRLACET